MDFALHLQHEEKDFITACVNKERWAQKKLYEDHYSMMMGVCLRYSNNREDALDILHEGFLKVFNHISKYQPGTSITAWIRRIMVNTAIDFYRKSIRRRTEDIENAYYVNDNDADAVSMCSEKEILNSCSKPLPRIPSCF